MFKKIIIIGAIAVLALSLFIYFNNRIVIDNTAFTLKEDLTAEVYSKVKVDDYIDNIEGKIIKKDKINTKKLGTKEISFIYLNSDNKKRMGTFEIEVIDTEKPLVWISSNYRYKVGSEIDFDSIICKDNYDDNPKCEVEGDFDVNTPGEYLLKYVATDSSGNKSESNFNLIIYEPAPVAETNTNNSSETGITEAPFTNFSDVLATHKNENTEIGIDVSKWQGDVDYKKVSEAGASFVMIRVGYQKGVKSGYEIDPYFKDNIKNALENDLKVGVYFYSYADSKKEAKKQGKWVIKQIKDYDITLPIVFDFESFDAFNEMELSIFGLNEIADAFIDEVESKGYKGMLYGSKNYLNAFWKYHTEPVWLAHYTDETDYTGDYTMWQLCDDGKIDGIEGYVDIDILYKK